MAVTPTERIRELNEKVIHLSATTEARLNELQKIAEELTRRLEALTEQNRTASERLAALEQKFAGQKETTDRLWNIVLAIVMAVVVGVVTAGINQLLPKSQPAPVPR